MHILISYSWLYLENAEPGEDGREVGTFLKNLDLS